MTLEVLRECAVQIYLPVISYILTYLTGSSDKKISLEVAFETVESLCIVHTSTYICTCYNVEYCTHLVSKLN